MLGLLMAGLLAIIYSIATVRPGVNVVIKDQPPARSAPTDTGVWFVTGTADQGPLRAMLVQSMSDFVTIYGQRATYSLLYDSLDTYFREGGRSAYVSRVVGPSPTVGTKNLLDAGSGVSLVANALGPGSYSAGIKVGVVAGVSGGTFQIQVTDGSNAVLEQSGDLTVQADAVNWSQTSNYIRIVLGATALVPAVVAPAVLSTGTDDRTNATDTQWANALLLFTADLGPGQVSHPGRTSDTAHAQLIAHAVANNRVALLDGPDTATAATLQTSAINARTNGRYAALFAPWAVVPGVTPGTTRTVPYSAVQAGMTARSDITHGPNKPVAGANGQAIYALGLSQAPWDDATRQSLNAQGVNVSVIKFGGVRTYGYRSLAHPVNDPYWIDFGNARLSMQIAARGSAILESFELDEIDGRGILFGQVDGQLTALMNEYWTLGELFGSGPTDAYRVVCDDSNNTPQTILNHELHASIAFRASEFAEMIQLDLIKVPVNQAL